MKPLEVVEVLRKKKEISILPKTSWRCLYILAIRAEVKAVPRIYNMQVLLIYID